MLGQITSVSSFPGHAIHNQIVDVCADRHLVMREHYVTCHIPHVLTDGTRHLFIPVTSDART